MRDDVTWHHSFVQRHERCRVTGGQGATVWLTGLSGSGKSRIAALVERRLIDVGRAAYRLDGDNLRHGLNTDLGFDDTDRVENVRRVGEVARLFADAGIVAVVSLISPFRSGRDKVRAQHADAGLPFFEIHVNTPLAICEERDSKGLYAKARSGELRHFTGIDSPYEPPTAAHLVLTPAEGDPERQAELVLELLGGTGDATGHHLRKAR